LANEIRTHYFNNFRHNTNSIHLLRRLRRVSLRKQKLPANRQIGHGGNGYLQRHIAGVGEQSKAISKKAIHTEERNRCKDRHAAMRHDT